MKLIALCALILSTTAFAQINYPTTKKVNQFENRFGTLIEDPYKWMENSSDPDLWSWIEEQKNVTADYLDAVAWDELSKRVDDYRKIKNEQNKITLEASKFPFSLTAIPNSDLEAKSRIIKWESAYKLKSNIFQKESSKYKIETRLVASGDLTRVIVTQKSDNKLIDILLVKFYGFVTWADDENFYYVSDMDERIGGGRPGLFRHTVGQIQSEDKLLIAAPKSTSDLVIHQLGDSFFAQVDDSIGSLQLASGKITNIQKLNGEIVEMLDSPEMSAVTLSFKKKNFGEIYRMRLRDGETTLMVPEQNFVLGKTKRLDNENSLVLGNLDGANVAAILNNGPLKRIDLNHGTIDYVGFKNGILKLGMETYSAPRKVYSYNLETSELTILASQTYPIEIDAEKIYYTASNGQIASMWVMKKKGVTLNSKTPTILYGYGGFKSSITPAFGMYETLPWMEKGGAFVVVTLPGSLDYGMSWYEVAQVGKRIHAWDSFALAGKELFKRGLTSKDHLGMLGASNGGTLVAGTLQRHSDTFKAAVPLVGVMDLLNFTLFTAGKYWTNDYGNPFVESDFRAIFPLSPYHNLQKRDYPATMVMTAEFDDRVVPMHSYKYLARLQEYNTSSAPILLYNKEWGAHGRASGSDRESSRYVGAYFTFFAQQLGL